MARTPNPYFVICSKLEKTASLDDRIFHPHKEMERIRIREPRHEMTDAQKRSYLDLFDYGYILSILELYPMLVSLFSVRLEGFHGAVVH